jgi:hypothetical protein
MNAEETIARIEAAHDSMEPYRYLWRPLPSRNAHGLPARWEVRTPGTDYKRPYTLNWNPADDTVLCTCPAATFKQGECKHALAFRAHWKAQPVRMAIRIQADHPDAAVSILTDIMAGKTVGARAELFADAAEQERQESAWGRRIADAAAQQERGAHELRCHFERLGVEHEVTGAACTVDGIQFTATGDTNRVNIYVPCTRCDRPAGPVSVLTAGLASDAWAQIGDACRWEECTDCQKRKRREEADILDGFEPEE